MFYRPLVIKDIMPKEDLSAIFSDLELIVQVNAQLMIELEDRAMQWPLPPVISKYNYFF